MNDAFRAKWPGVLLVALPVVSGITWFLSAGGDSGDPDLLYNSLFVAVPQWALLGFMRLFRIRLFVRVGVCLALALDPLLCEAVTRWPTRYGEGWYVFIFSLGPAVVGTLLACVYSRKTRVRSVALNSLCGFAIQISAFLPFIAWAMHSRPHGN